MDSPSKRSADPGETATPDEVARLLSALADPTRLRILALLRTGDRCVCEIHRALGLSPPNVSHHLALLRQAGFVTRRRDRFWVHYELASHRSDVIRDLVEALEPAIAASPQGRADRAALDSRPVCCAHAPRAARVELPPSRPGRPGAPRSAPSRVPR